MKLYHYTPDPFTLDRTRTYTQNGNFKPHGLWLSAEAGTDYDHGWKQWCEGEDFNVEGLTHRTEIVLRGANILTLEGPTALDMFTREYVLPDVRFHSLDKIDWHRVIALYDGILIAPYVWERRHDLMWYYSWDCASACIWNSSVLDTTNQLLHSSL